jgi:hypothetical protein
MSFQYSYIFLPAVALAKAGPTKKLPLSGAWNGKSVYYSFFTNANTPAFDWGSDDGLLPLVAVA